jgi:hypothetical protein
MEVGFVFEGNPSKGDQFEEPGCDLFDLLIGQEGEEALGPIVIPRPYAFVSLSTICSQVEEPVKPQWCADCLQNSR